jgi:hypothetical protein
LKRGGFELWVNCIQLVQPHHGSDADVQHTHGLDARRSDTQVVNVKEQNLRLYFVTGFSRWVKGQAQGLQPGGFKLRVNWIGFNLDWIQLERGPHHVPPSENVASSRATRNITKPIPALQWYKSNLKANFETRISHFSFTG